MDSSVSGKKEFDHEKTILHDSDRAIDFPSAILFQGKGNRPRAGALSPDFTLTALDGSFVNLEDLRGSAVFINFWMTACRYCQYEMPNIQYMHKTYASEGLIVLGVNVGGSQSDAEGYTRRLKITSPILLDSDGKINDSYLVTGYPTSFYIDREGVIDSIYIGELTKVEMEKHVKAILN